VTPAFTKSADWGLVDLVKNLGHVGLGLNGIVHVIVEGVRLEMMVQGNLKGLVGVPHVDSVFEVLSVFEAIFV
tara:strand:+ start:343 stop:561 length:219 start_codon:yes stop_codon:yes gene_type:complete